ncbi:unnamed protein product [Lepeophtheirus salmonis]|uniref:(salmon louse) hypothetical protein n=1 Tax=Lepeophtheirus salmonis TaxID=72036 RepID=A0A7R8HCA2_LEPSM|nr:unnamed protein product [Lepeophtheirus salmonis]CAF3003338.1 unnamed protein product [Lepeophtheirus salmonis]
MNKSTEENSFASSYILALKKNLATKSNKSRLIVDLTSSKNDQYPSKPSNTIFGILKKEQELGKDLPCLDNSSESYSPEKEPLLSNLSEVHYIDEATLSQRNKPDKDHPKNIKPASILEPSSDHKILQWDFKHDYKMKQFKMPRWILEDEDFQQSLQRRLTMNFDRTLSASRKALGLSNTIQVTTINFFKRRREASRKFNDNLDVILT